MLSESEMRTLIEGSDPKGGYLVDREFHTTMIEALREQNIVRSLATIIDTLSDRDIPIDESDGTAYWEGEGEDDTEGDETLKAVTLGAFKAVRMVKVSEELLEDSMFPLEPFISRKFARSVGALEEASFISGNGVKRPLGLTVSAAIGKTTAANNAITADELLDLYHSLKSAYRAKGSFILNDATALVIRKLKNAVSGDYMWQPGLQANQPDRLLGRPVYTSSYMPVIAVSAKVILFGDISFYFIGQRGGFRFRRLDERYIDKGLIGFRGTERVDGKLTVAESVQVMQMKTS
jgi:HK97 family phage major capsid protein